GVHTHDVFIVHGTSCTDWVVHQLLQLLEQNLDDLEDSPAALRLASRINLIKKIWHPSCKSIKTKKTRTNKPSKDLEFKYVLGSNNNLPVDTNFSPNRRPDWLTREPMPENTQNMQKVDKSSLSVATCGVLIQEPPNVLDVRQGNLLQNISKNKSDLFLHLPRTENEFTAKSRSLQNQRVQNMVSATNVISGSTVMNFPKFQTISAEPSTNLGGMNLDTKLAEHNSLFVDEKTFSDQKVKFDDTPSHHFDEVSCRDRLTVHTDRNESNVWQRSIDELKKNNIYNPNNIHNPNCDNNRVHDGNFGFASNGKRHLESYSNAVAPFKPKLVRRNTLDETTEPDTPCSETPFIMPEKSGNSKDISSVRKQNSTVVGSLLLCCRTLFLQSPEAAFWQRLLLQLPAVPLKRMKRSSDAAASLKTGSP
ncbi:uncharacterized protein LOC108674862, partial [Hyalella azteca]|uniref:Uncharacterized protein LOC108674862 n=1 Tax=Hyalella azteca TaxID=294128 RepID=A0A8B7NX89_HYAAZ